MTLPLEKSLRKAGNTIADNAVDFARVALPASAGYAYSVTQGKIEDHEQIPGFFRFCADWPFFKGNDIDFLYNANEAAAGLVGATGAAYAAHSIDRTTEKLMPNSPRLRKLAQAGSYFTLANLTNFLGSIGEKARESKGVLEGLYFNMQDTFVRSYNVLQDMVNFTDRPDSDLTDTQKMTSIGALTLLGLAGARLFGKQIENTWSYLYGAGREERVARRITRDLKNKAKEKAKESKQLKKIAEKREEFE